MNRHATITYTRFFESACLPDLDDIDFIIALGGPMSVNDEEQFPGLVEEKLFIAEAIGKNKIVLGICLGCQLIASALGAKVYPGIEKEIGWFPVYSLHQSRDIPVFPSSFEAFHWHGETFDLPTDAVLLASSTVCRHQAFQVGRHILGLQFHLEATPESAKAMIAHCRHELLAQRFIQTEQQLLNITAARYEVINTLMAQVLEHLLAYDGPHR
ncbi:MAG: gamma-glutamyl-gamma-aminobutyrate hydrolase family protein [Methylococcaceae bacterium]